MAGLVTLWLVLGTLAPGAPGALAAAGATSCPELCGRSASVVSAARSSRVGTGAQSGRSYSALGPPSYVWPLEGPILRAFEAPATPYSSGHRGIDIGAAFSTPVVAAGDGVVAFAGWVAGSLFVSIDHADGVRTTYSWLSAIAVSRGDAVHAGQRIAKSGHGHPELAGTHLHFGALFGGTYVDPMLLLEGRSAAGVIHLAPVEDARVLSS